MNEQHSPKTSSLSDIVIGSMNRSKRVGDLLLFVNMQTTEHMGFDDGRGGGAPLPPAQPELEQEEDKKAQSLAFHAAAGALNAMAKEDDKSKEKLGSEAFQGQIKKRQEHAMFGTETRELSGKKPFPAVTAVMMVYTPEMLCWVKERIDAEKAGCETIPPRPSIIKGPSPPLCSLPRRSTLRLRRRYLFVSLPFVVKALVHRWSLVPGYVSSCFIF